MQQWLVAVCALRFDLEQGQIMEDSYPGRALTQEEESHVAFCAFPDSTIQQTTTTTQRIRIHDSIFFFRIPRSKAQQQGDHLYGYVFNRQRQDERLKRGGEQKSVVILSHLPHWRVFKPLVQIAGPLFFDIGVAALEKIASCVCSWPPPKHGSVMELPVCSNKIIRAHLPPAQTLPPGCVLGFLEDLNCWALPPASAPQGIFDDADLFGVLRGVLMQLWLLWELALIGEPLLVISPTPSVSSEAVAAIVSLIAPLPCNLDFRPYFTIHDPDLSTFLLRNSSTAASPLPSMILGVTNVFFLKALPNFPHVLSLGTGSATPNQQARSLSFLSKNNRDRWNTQISGLRTNYNPITKPDTSVLNHLLDAGAASSPRLEESVALANSDTLRRHFLDLTTNFLLPLEEFLRPAEPPGKKSSSLFADPPPLPPFDVQRFLHSLAQNGPGKFLVKRLRSNWIELYRRFLSGPNFHPWFQARRAVAEKEQHDLWRHARARMDVRSLLADMSELELVDLFHAIVRRLVSELQMPAAPSKAISISEKLRMDLRVVFNMLPKDMQQLLLANPRHATLLQINHREGTSSSSMKLPGRPSIHISWHSEPPPLSPFGLSVTLAQELASDPLDLDKS